MNNVTQLVPNFLGGVSKQSDIKKSAGQVRECINAYVDPTFGLVKRPGLQWLNTLATTDTAGPSSSELDGGKWFFYLRDNLEAYFGCITNGTPGEIYMWNAITQAPCTVTYVADAQQYLDEATNAHSNYDVLTIQDTTIITNKTTRTDVLVTPQNGVARNSAATIQLTLVEYSAKYSVTINGQTFSFRTRNGDDISDPSQSTDRLDADEILKELRTGILGLNQGLTVTRLSTSLELVSNNNTPFTIDTSGGIDGRGLFHFQTDVDDVSQLPEESVADRIVQIINSPTVDQDDYWLEFTPDNGNKGKGTWTETIDPSVSQGYNASTMPHELVSTAPNTFVFQQIPWAPRLVGDDTTNPQPSFVGNTISKVFLYQNRLGILSQDNVIFSESGKFYTFWRKSAGTVIDSDPIDISTSNIRPSILFQAIPVTQGLVLFSRYQQFLLTSVNGSITFSNTRITALSNYEVNDDTLPVDNGTTLAFISKNSGYTKLFGYVTEGQNDNPVALDVSKVVATYIPNNINLMTPSPQNDFIALASNEDHFVYLFKSFSNGQTTLFQAWTKWDMPGDVQTMAIINDTWFMISKNEDDSYVLSIAPIDQLATGEVFETEDGVFGNPAMDYYTHPSSVQAGTVDDVEGYKVYLTQPLLENENPIIISTVPSDFGVRSSLLDLPRMRRNPVPFHIDPDTPDGMVFEVTSTGTDNIGNFFFVAGSMLEDFNPAHLIVGYSFEFIVDLPKMYYKRGTDTTEDYTAVNTIARYQFSTGLTGDLSFNIKAGGREEYVQLQEIAMPGDYRANNAQLMDEFVFNVPIHQRNSNFDFRVYSQSPFPTALVSMMWEGTYSPKYYKRK